MSKKAKIIEGTKALNNATRDKKRILGDALATLGGVSSALVPNYAERNSVPSASLPVLEKAFVDTYEKKDVNPISRMSPILNTATALTGNVGFKLAADMGSDNSYQNSRQQTRDLYNSIKNTKTEKALENADVPEINTMPTIMGMSNGAYGLNNAGVSREDAQRYYDKKNREKNEKRLTDLANAHPVLSSLGAVISNPIESAEGNITNGLNYLLSKPLEESYTPSNTIRQTVSDKIDSKAGKFAYNVGNSMADMALAALLGKYLGNTGAAAGTMGLEKANQVMNDAIERGLNPDQIVKEGASSGLSTALTEMLPFDMLKKGGNVFGAMAAEGGQEVAEDILDSVFDELITRSGNNKDKAALRQQYNAYKDAGYSDTEALDAVSLEYLKQLGLDFAAGAISGGALQGGSNFLQGRNVITGKLPTLETQTEENITAPKVDVSPNENDTVNEWDRQAQERRNEDFAKLNELLKQQAEQQTEKPIEELQKPVEETREEKPIEKPVDLNEVKAIAEETENAIPEVQPNPAETIAQQREVRDLTNLASQYENKLNAFASESDAETKKIAKGLIKDLNNAVKSGDAQAIRDSIANIDSTMKGAQVGYDARKFNKEAYQQMQEATDGYKIKIKPSELNNLNLGVKNVSEMDAKYGQTGSRNRLHFVAPTNENGFYIDEVYDEIRDKSANALPDGNNMNSTEKLQALMKYISDPKSDRGDLLNVQSWEDVGTYDSRPEPVIEAEKLSDKFIDELISGNPDAAYDNFISSMSELAKKYPDSEADIRAAMMQASEIANSIPESATKLDEDIQNIQTLEEAVDMLNEEIDSAIPMTTDFFSNSEGNTETESNEEYGRVNTGRTRTSEAYTNTGKESGIMTEEEEARHDSDDSMQMIENSEKESMDEANARIKKNGSVNEYKRLINKTDFTNVDIDESMILWRELSEKVKDLKNRGLDYKRELQQAYDLFTKIKNEASAGGSRLQALAKWSRNNTPEGLLSEATAIINRAKIGADGRVDWNKAVAKETKGKTDSMDINFMDRFLTEAEKLEGLDINSREARHIMANLGKMVNSQIPITLREKVQTLLMDNMLGNARTLLTRNAGGNIGFNLLEEFARKPLAALIDKQVAKKTGVRTTAGLSRAGIKAGWEGFKAALGQEAYDFKNDIQSARSGENTLANAVGNNRNALTSKIGKMYNKLVKAGLSVGDRPFYEFVYNQSMVEYQQLYKDGLLGDMSRKDFEELAKAYSQLNALTAVYQDNSMISQAFLEMKQAVNDLSQGIVGADVLSQFTMPFVKTPANIIQRAIEYSPIGIVKNAIQTVRELKSTSQDLNQARFVNETARNILGTALFVGSMAMANAGAMTGSYSEDKDMKQAQKEAGMQEYALHNPFGLNADVDVSWIPVLGNNLVAGAAAYDAASKPELSLAQQFGKGATAGLKSQFESSMLQGLQRLVGGSGSFGNDGGDILSNSVDTLKSGATQFIPSILRQTAAAFDPYQRQLSGANPDDYYINSVLSAIPRLRQNLQPKISRTGEALEQNHAKTQLGQIINNYINPANITYGTEDAVRDEAMRLFESTGNNIAFQPSATISELKSDDHIPTAEEFTEYQRNAYGSMNSIASTLIDSDYYQGLSDGDKESLLADVYSAVKTVEKTKVLNGDTENFSGPAKAFYEDGEDGLVNYLVSRNAINEMGISNDEKARDSLIDIYDSEGADGLDKTVNGYLQNVDKNTSAVNGYINKDNYIPTEDREQFNDECTKAIQSAEKYKSLGYDMSKLNGAAAAYATGGTQELYNYQVAKYYLDSMGLANNEKNRNIVLDKLNEGGVNAVKEMAQNTQQMQSLGFDTNMTFKYEHAQKAIPTLSPTQFAETWNAIDQQKEGESGYGSIKIDEVIDYLNKTPDKYNDKTALQLWNAYYSGDSAKIPVLDPKTGLWKAK